MFTLKFPLWKCLKRPFKKGLTAWCGAHFFGIEVVWLCCIVSTLVPSQGRITHVCFVTRRQINYFKIWKSRLLCKCFFGILCNRFGAFLLQNRSPPSSQVNISWFSFRGFWLCRLMYTFNLLLGVSASGCVTFSGEWGSLGFWGDWSNSLKYVTKTATYSAVLWFCRISWGLIWCLPGSCRLPVMAESPKTREWINEISRKVC